MKLRVRNHTDYRTEDLRRFFNAGLKAMGAKKAKVIDVRHANGLYTCSRATIGVSRKVPVPDDDGGTKEIWRTHEGTWIRMLAYTKNGEKGRELDMRYLARVFEHEVLHSKGARHKDMTQHQRDCDLPMPAWAEGIEIRKKEAKPELTLEERRAKLVAEREEHARRMAISYDRKLNRLRKLQRKWAAKVRYYERRNAAEAAKQGEVREHAEGNEKG